MCQQCSCWTADEYKIDPNEPDPLNWFRVDERDVKLPEEYVKAKAEKDRLREEKRWADRAERKAKEDVIDNAEWRDALWARIGVDPDRKAKAAMA